MLLPRVNLLMSLLICFNTEALAEALATLRARIRLPACMTALMDEKIWSTGKLLSTYFALVRFVARMRAAVHDLLRSLLEGFSTCVANVRFFASMVPFVASPLLVCTKPHRTVRTRVGRFASAHP